MANDKSDILLDLDALAPPVVKMNFKGKVIEIKPPDLEQYARIVDLAEKLTKSKSKGGENIKYLSGIYKEIDTYLKELIPELADYNLNYAQISSLFKLMSEIGAPTDRAVAKLKEQGIQLKPDNKSPKASA